MTSYVVLYGSDHHNAWKDVGTVEASSATRAIQFIANDDTAEDGEYVAVPTRSWKPVKVTTETERKVRIRGTE